MGGRGSRLAGSSSSVQRLEDLVLQGDLAAEIDLDAQFDGQQLGRFRRRGWRRCCSSSPWPSSLARMVRAGTPIASEKVRTVQGRSTTTLPLRGAAVLAPVRRMCVRRAAARAAPERRLFFAGRRWTRGRPLPLQLPLLASAQRRGGPFPSSSATGGDARRRGAAARGRTARPSGGRRGFRSRRAAAGFARRPFLAAASSFAFFSSCLRRCSESGLLPARVARIASARELDVRASAAPAPRPSASPAAGRPPASAPTSAPAVFLLPLPSFSPGPLRRRFFFAAAVFRSCDGFTGTFPDPSPLREPCILAAESVPSFTAGGDVRLLPAPPRGAAVGPRRAWASGGRLGSPRPSGSGRPRRRHERLQRRQFLVRQAGQRRPLPLDTCLVQISTNFLLSIFSSLANV